MICMTGSSDTCRLDDSPGAADSYCSLTLNELLLLVSYLIPAVLQPLSKDETGQCISSNQLS